MPGAAGLEYPANYQSRCLFRIEVGRGYSSSAGDDIVYGQAIMLVHVLPLVLLILSMELVNPYASCALLALTITLVPLIVIRYVILPLAPTEVTSRVLAL